MSERAKQEIIIIRESWLKSWLRDASTLALFVSMIGIGWMIGSTVMQWVGAIIAFIAIGVKASGKSKAVSIEQARRRLDEIEAGR